jgi:hypothetical protein
MPNYKCTVYRGTYERAAIVVEAKDSGEAADKAHDEAVNREQEGWRFLDCDYECCTHDCELIADDNPTD